MLSTPANLLVGSDEEYRLLSLPMLGSSGTKLAPLLQPELHIISEATLSLSGLPDS